MTASHSVASKQHRWPPRNPDTLLVAGLLFLCILLQPVPVAATTLNKTASVEQILFWEAKKSLRQDNLERFEHLATQLKEYPLYPYLIYWKLQKQLHRAKPATVAAFLNRYDNLPLAKRLRIHWLQALAEQERWKTYIRFYRPIGYNSLRCHYYFAQHKVGNDKAAWQGARTLWLVGHSQEEACNPLFAAWQESGGLTQALRWQRIELLMDNSNTRLASYVAREMDKKDQSQLELWQRAYREPSLLTTEALKTDNKPNRRIIFHTLKHRAIFAPHQTAKQWRKLEPRYRFSASQRQAITRAVATGYSYRNDERALQWYNRLPTETHDINVCRTALRVALRNRLWGEALAWLNVMPPQAHRSDRSQYWRGRIYEQMGFKEVARHFYKTINKQRSYYGFLAADHLNTPYNLNHDPLQVDQDVYNLIANLPAMIRARELYQLGLIIQARREWRLAVTHMNSEELQAAGKLADEWGWHDRALHTLAQADHFDDLHIRFPLIYTDTVKKEAKQRALDPAWVYAVARQESGLMPNIQSPVGALGLMQLLPRTGRALARQLRIATPNRYQLLQPEINIRLGSLYLHQVLKEFDHNPVLATAAYNAGPGRVRNWYPKKGKMDADIWVDTIPFSETRKYVRMVMAYSVFYDYRLGKAITRLRDRMPPINDKKFIGQCSSCNRTPLMLARDGVH